MDKAAELLASIQNNTDNRFPRQELQYLIDHPDESIPALLALIEDVIENFERYYAMDDFIGHLYAFFLLAQFREKRACPLIIQFFVQHGDRAEEMSGDFVTEDLARVLASVFDGDLTLLQSLIENYPANRWVRSAVVGCLPILVIHEMVPIAEVIAYFRELFTHKLEREYNAVWDGLVVEAVRLCPHALQDELRQAFAEGLIDEGVIGESAIDEALTVTQEVHLSQLRADHHYQLSGDTIKEMEWWAAFRPPMQSPRKPLLTNLTPQNFVESRPKPGRNDPCHCGSGKKYKKCCWPN